MRRLNWGEFYFLIAIAYSIMGACNRLKTACVLVKDNRIIGIGFNGSLSGLDHCDEAGHLMIDGHCERTVHAEENALLNVENRKNAEGASAYIIGAPCIRCAKSLIASGIKEIFYVSDYQNSRGREFVREIAEKKGVLFKKIEINPLELIKKMILSLRDKGGILEKKDRSLMEMLELERDASLDEMIEYVNKIFSNNYVE